jgi:hypothetical protein
MDSKYILDNFRKEVTERIRKREKLNKIFWSTAWIVLVSFMTIMILIFIYIAICNYLYL